MILYNVRIALKSIRRNPVLSAVIIGGIALGIGVSTTFITLHHVVAQDPIPHKSDDLFYVRLDSWDPNRAYEGNVPPIQITYQDMKGIMKSDIPVRQSGMFKSGLYIYPDEDAGRPFRTSVRLCFKDFFEMFDVPMRYGSGWDSQADARPEPVVVLSEPLNQKLFGGRDSTGETLRIEDREFRVVGVLDRWRPSVRLYDLTQNAVAPPESLFMPFHWFEEMQIRTSGNMDNWANFPADGFEGFLLSESAWLQMWVELPDEESRAAYAEFLDSYALEQRKHGRFQRPLDNHITTVTDLMAEWEIVPPQASAMMYIAVLFLAVCALNLMGLLLGKFLSRAPEVGVRRALGASRTSVFLQHIVECEVVGILGGGLGIGLSLLGLFLVNRATPFGAIFHLDTTMIGVSVALSLAAGLIAGLYPAWRICAIQPAVHLKLQ